MLKIARPRVLLLVTAGALLACMTPSFVAAQEGKQLEAIALTIRLPADAILLIDDHPTQSAGGVRAFQTPALPVGGHYAYTLKATSQGKEVTRKIHLAHGMDNTFDLRAEFLPLAGETVHPKHFSASTKRESVIPHATAIWGASLRTVDQALDTEPVNFRRLPK
jgi:uncharacterized protein (TIGR03000 family)